jgi:hypothetical protein
MPMFCPLIVLVFKQSLNGRSVEAAVGASAACNRGFVLIAVIAAAVPAII